MKLEEAIKSSRFTDAKHKAAVNLMYTSYWMKTHLNTVLKQNGLTIEQFNVLRILKGKHPEQMCVKDIGSRTIEELKCTKDTRQAVAKKLVKRTPSKEDKRETLVSLTDKGIKQVEDANIMVDSLQKDVIGLDLTEAALLNELLEKMRKAE